MWTIAYRWNGQAYVERYESWVVAFVRWDKLKVEGKEPSIHYKDDKDDKMAKKVAT